MNLCSQIVRSHFTLWPVLAVAFLFTTINNPSAFAASENTAAQPQAAGDGGLVGTVFRSIKNIVDYFTETAPKVDLSPDKLDNPLPQVTESRGGMGVLALLPDLAGTVFNGGLRAPLIYPFLVADVPPTPLDLNNQTEIPQVPAIDREVVGITEQGFTQPHLPPLRWSADGRLGVNSQVGGFPNDPFPIRLHLLRPESLQTPLVESPAGPTTLVLEATELPFQSLSPNQGVVIQHANLCDPISSEAGARNNPYVCGENNNEDCYDLTLIASLTEEGVDPPNPGALPAQLNNWDRVMGIPLHVRVTNPKTAEAAIAEVRLGEPTYAPNRSGVLFETITPADGRLLVARRAFMPLLWQNTATEQAHLGSYDIVYSVAPPEAPACDVSYWSDFYPITHAPYDDRVNSRYLFAQQPFRDPSGELIPDGADIKGTYPWMDKEAKMFSMQASPGKLFPTYTYDRNPKSRYPARCVSEDNCSFDGMNDTDISKDNIFIIIGAWTQGKMVLLDGPLNDIDYRLGVIDEEQSILSLYQPNTGVNGTGSGEKRVGATRITTTVPLDIPVYDADNQLLGHYAPRNTSMFDSIENRFNYLEPFNTTKPQDIVWLTSSGHSTEEFAFDDYLNPDAFIVSNMVGLMQWRNSNWYKMTYFDGWHSLAQDFVGQVRIQNSATALADRWLIPAYGRAHNTRLEPVANGGIRGKGLWFNGVNTRIDYEIPEQPQPIHQNTWFYGLFIDPRDTQTNADALLIQFPDNSALIKSGRSQLIYQNHRGEDVAEISLPFPIADTAWTHLGLLIEDSTQNSFTHSSANQSISLFVNGFPLHHWNNPHPDKIFTLAPGKLSVGSSAKSPIAFKGWIDEFKVFAHEPTLESICNLAHGTLVGLPSNYEGRWRDTADNFPALMHELVSSELASYGQATFESYACYHNYTDDHLAHKKNIPEGLISIRENLHFPEGPLYHDAPRPDSTTNEFCLSCHHSQGLGGLSLAALTTDNIEAKHDPRRQPSQPPQKVFGYLPENWLPQAFVNDNPGLDADSGLLIDEWIQPSSANSFPELRNLVFADDHGHVDSPLITGASYDAATILPYLRANVNGLTQIVSFQLNGEELTDTSSPFLLPTSLLRPGTNELSITAHFNGRSSSEKNWIFSYNEQ